MDSHVARMTEAEIGTASAATPLASCRLCGSSDLVTVLDLGDQALTGVFPRSTDEEVSSGAARARVVPWVHAASARAQLRADRDVRRQLRLPVRLEPVDGRASRAQGCGVSRHSSTSRRATSSSTSAATTGRSWGHTRRVRSSGSASTRPPKDSRASTPTASRSFRRSSRRRASGAWTAAPARIITSIAMFYDLEDPVAFARDVRGCLAPTASGTSSSRTCRRCSVRPRTTRSATSTSSTTRSRPSSRSSTRRISS